MLTRRAATMAAARHTVAAAEGCRHILDMYAETPAAGAARSLLVTLQTRPSP